MLRLKANRSRTGKALNISPPRTFDETVAFDKTATHLSVASRYNLHPEIRREAGRRMRAHKHANIIRKTVKINETNFKALQNALAEMCDDQNIERDIFEIFPCSYL